MGGQPALQLHRPLVPLAGRHQPVQGDAAGGLDDFRLRGGGNSTRTRGTRLQRFRPLREQRRALVQGAAALLEKAGAKRTAQWLHRMPRGMPTVLQKELQWLIYTDLLELPYVQEGLDHRVGHLS